ncbi:MAG: carbohydrate kinase family protein [Pseudomonadota bacterium]
MNNLILGLGAAAMDVVLDCEDLPRADGFALVHGERLVPGGSCANVLAAAVRLGARAGLVAKMGDDDYGRAFIEDLRRSGVSTDQVLVQPGGVSLHTFITVARDGAKAIFAHFGDSLLNLAADEVQPDWLDGVGLFYTDMFPGKPALKLARIARERRIRVMFNLQASVGFMGLCGVSQDEIEEMIGLCDLFITFSHPLEELTGSGDPVRAAAAIMERRRPRDGVVITMGEKGAVWGHESGTIARPSFAVPAVDSTGAGDAFAAGLIYSFYFQGLPRDRALSFAAATGAVKCTQPGPRLTADVKDVLALMNREAS